MTGNTTRARKRSKICTTTLPFSHRSQNHNVQNHSAVKPNNIMQLKLTWLKVRSPMTCQVCTAARPSSKMYVNKPMYFTLKNKQKKTTQPFGTTSISFVEQFKLDFYTFWRKRQWCFTKVNKHVQKNFMTLQHTQFHMHNWPHRSRAKTP